MTPIQASLKKNEGYVFFTFQNSGIVTLTPKFQLNELVRVADLKKTFSKGDTTNWSNKLYKITELIVDTIPSNRLDNLPERYNESLLKKLELTMKENNSVMKKN